MICNSYPVSFISFNLILLLSSWGRWVYLEDQWSLYCGPRSTVPYCTSAWASAFVILCHMKTLIRNYYIFQKCNIGCQNNPSHKTDAEMCGMWIWPPFCQMNLPQRSFSVPSGSSCFSNWRSTKCLCPSTLCAIHQGLPNIHWDSAILTKLLYNATKTRFEMVLGAISMQFFMIHTDSESAP